MTDKTEFKYWEESGDILIKTPEWDCFLCNESLNPMINWLNLHRAEIENENGCEGTDKTNEITYISVRGFLTIVTNRDMVNLKKTDLERFVAWLNENRDVLKIRGVWG